MQYTQILLPQEGRTTTHWAMNRKLRACNKFLKFPVFPPILVKTCAVVSRSNLRRTHAEHRRKDELGIGETRISRSHRAFSKNRDFKA
jgi:hypothetical protein